MPAEPRQSVPTTLRLTTAIAMIALAAMVVGCGGKDVQTTPTSLQKPALAVPGGSIDTSAGKKSGSTGSTSSTTSDDSADSGDSAGADTGGAGTGGEDTGGAGTGTGTDTGGAGTGGAGTGGAAPGN